MTSPLIPNSTQVPNVILDLWMAELSGAELKVVLYVARRTYGFHKQSDQISINQIATGITKRDGTVLDRGTGLSRSTVKATCNALVEKGILLKTTNLSDTSDAYAENTYRLNLEADLSPHPPQARELEATSGGEKEVGRKSAHVSQKVAEEVGRKSAQGGPETVAEVGQNSAPQNKEEQKPVIQKTAAAKAVPPRVRRPIPKGYAAAEFSENVLIARPAYRIEQLVSAKEVIAGDCAKREEQESFEILCADGFDSSKAHELAGQYSADFIRECIKERNGRTKSSITNPQGYLISLLANKFANEEEAREAAQNEHDRQAQQQNAAKIAREARQTRRIAELERLVRQIEEAVPEAFTGAEALREAEWNRRAQMAARLKPEHQRLILAGRHHPYDRLVYILDYYSQNECPYAPLAQYLRAHRADDIKQNIRNRMSDSGS